MNTPPSAPRASGIRRVTWRIWPWLNWLLPIVLCLFALATGRGVLPMLVVFAAPLLIPAAGLLGALPRRLLRRQGVSTATPAAVTWLLVLHWWGWVGMAVTMPDDTFVGVRPSPLQRLMGQQLSEAFWTGLFVGSIIIASATWIAVLVISSNPPPCRSTFDGGIGSRGRPSCWHRRCCCSPGRSASE